jgi:pimeloyl-ACP methyl ester carboxylesterase
MRERRATVAGTEVLWHEHEPRTPTPTLYVHGVPNNGALWLPFLERTGGIAPDLPGFGRSGKSAGFDHSITGYGDFLEAFLDQLGVERFQLIMHDWGSVGLELAQRRPGAVKRLVLVDVVPFVPGYRWHPSARIWRTPLAGELFMGASNKFMAKLMLRRLRALPPDAIDAEVDAVFAEFDHGTQRAILRLYRSAPSEVLARAGDRLGDVEAPSLVVWGARDPFLPPRFAHALANALGGPAEVDLVEGAGHWPWIDKPAVVERITGFLGGS